jgi:Transposase and inactivated derivatives
MSSYYYSVNRKTTERDIENLALTDIIKKVFGEYKGRYGSKRILRELRSREIYVNHKRVERIMAQNGLKAKYSCKRHGRYSKAYMASFNPNYLNREFDVKERNKVWVGDITYIPTKEGYEYLMAYLDLFSRKVVGWSVNRHLREQLAIDALNDAFNRENPGGGLMVHTDRGAQFLSDRYNALIKRKGAFISMSRGGNPYDNAVMEAFNKSLKSELIDKKHPFETRDLARKEIFEYIEMFYNPVRLHSALGYKSPIEFEKMHFNSSIYSMRPVNGGQSGLLTL